jgi:hypothetical protein
MRPVLFALLLTLPLASAEARKITAKTRQLAFEYDWPALPPGLKRLEAKMAGEAASERRRAQRRAGETWAKERSPDTDSDPPRHGFEKRWRIRGVTARLLSLEGDIQLYAGGAHEAIDYDAWLWDRAGDAPLALADLFTAPKTALAAMEKGYCRQLKADQKERRGDGYREEDFRCPPLATVPVVLTGSGGRLSGYEALLQPYRAGSFAEGPYEVEVRFTAALLKLVKPEFRAGFTQ